MDDEGGRKRLLPAFLLPLNFNEGELGDLNPSGAGSSPKNEVGEVQLLLEWGSDVTLPILIRGSDFAADEGASERHLRLPRTRETPLWYGAR